MKKLFILFALLNLTACAALKQPTPATKTTSTVTADTPATGSTPVTDNTPQPVRYKIFYDAKVQKYIDNNSAVQKLRTCCPEKAQKLLATHCTVEKFAAGLNAPEIRIEKNSSDSIIIHTAGTKIGSGKIEMAFDQDTPRITSAAIGKIQQKDASILKSMAQNICQKVEEKVR